MIFLDEMVYRLFQRKLYNYDGQYNDGVDKDMYKFEDAIKNKVHLGKEEKAKAKPRMDFYNFK